MTTKIKIPKDRPLRVAILGIDCSGKTMLADGLKKAFNGLGLNTEVINFPRLKTTSSKINKVIDLLERMEIHGHNTDNKRVVMAAWSLMGIGYPIKKITTSGKDIVFHDRDVSIEPLVYASYYGINLRPALVKWLSRFPDIILKLRCTGKIAKIRAERKCNKTPKGMRKIQMHERNSELLKQFDDIYKSVVKILEKEYGIPVVYVSGINEFEKSDREKSIEIVCNEAFVKLKRLIKTK